MRRRRWSQGELERAERDLGLIGGETPRRPQPDAMGGIGPVSLLERLSIAAAVLGAIGGVLASTSLEASHGTLWVLPIVGLAMLAPAAVGATLAAVWGVWLGARWVVTGR